MKRTAVLAIVALLACQSVVWSAPDFPASTAILDDFNRTDEGPPPSASWTDLSATGISVVSNQAATTGTSTNTSRFDTVFGPDVDHYVTVATLPTTAFDAFSVFGRIQDATVNGYAFITLASSPDRLAAFRLDAGVATQLGARVDQDLVAGDKIGLRCAGSAIEAWRFNSGAWAQILTRTDATHGAAGKVALSMQRTVARADDLSGGTVTSPKRLMTLQVGEWLKH